MSNSVSEAKREVANSTKSDKKKKKKEDKEKKKSKEKVNKKSKEKNEERSDTLEPSMERSKDTTISKDSLTENKSTDSMKARENGQLKNTKSKSKEALKKVSQEKVQSPNVKTGKVPTVEVSLERVDNAGVMEKGPKPRHRKSFSAEPTQVSKESKEKLAPLLTARSEGSWADKGPPMRSFQLTEKSTRRIKYVRERTGERGTRRREERTEKTIKGERKFLNRIKKYREKKVERECICPLNKWLLFKEWLERVNGRLHRCSYGCWVFCCPPFCAAVTRVAFWPPVREYYFYHETDVKHKERRETEGAEEAIEIRERKKKIKKLKKANKVSTSSTWRIGIRHDCAEDIDDVEGFVVKTKSKHYLGCVKVPYQEGSPRYSILYSHPNASDLSDHLVGVPNLQDIARFYRCEVYGYDYSGYGISTGNSSEKTIKEDIEAVYKHITGPCSVDPARVILIGYSIGTFATIYLTSKLKVKPAGVILMAPPTSILGVILHKDDDGLRERICCADCFSTFDIIDQVKVPILIVHGDEDSRVPICHGKVLYDKIRPQCKVQPLWIPRAGHDNVENCHEVWKRIRKFLNKEIRPAR